MSVPKKTGTRPVNSANEKIKEYIHVWNEIAAKQGMVGVNEEDKKQVTTAAVMINLLLKEWPKINSQAWSKVKDVALTPDYLRNILLTAIKDKWFMLCDPTSVHNIATILAEKNFTTMLTAIKKKRRETSDTSNN